MKQLTPPSGEPQPHNTGLRVNSGRIQKHRKFTGKEGPKRQPDPITWNENQVSDSVHLADMDDLVTGLVLDPYLGFQTHKMNIGHHSKNWDGPLSSELKRIVNDFEQNSDYRRAIFDIHALVLSYNVHISKKDFCYFNFHLKSYLEMLDRNNGFEIQSCSRYAGDGDHGAKIITTRIRAKGERLRILGFYAVLTPEELCTLIGPHNSFSIKITTRPRSGGTTQKLYLGPAAFVNHSCLPNCEEVFDKTTDSVGLPYSYFTVIRPIDAGEELTFNYGRHYFDKNECRCKSCKPALWVEPNVKKSPGDYNLRRTVSRFRFNSKRHALFSEESDTSRNGSDSSQSSSPPTSPSASFMASPSSSPSASSCASSCTSPCESFSSSL